MTRAKDISKIVTDADLSGTLDVTGAVTAGGLTVNGDGSLNGTAVNLIFNETDTTDLNTRFRQSGALFSISTVNDSGSSPKAHLVVNNSTGDISFYEDTGTTPKFFWDASEERLGLGTSSPNELLHANGSAVSGLQLTTNTYTNGTVFKVQGDGSSYIYNTENAMLRFGTNNLERVRIDSSGNVGIGTSSPTYGKLQIENNLAGTQERCIYANQGQTSGTSANNVAMFSASNSAFSGDLVRIHHESPNSNQVMFKTTTTGSNTVGFSIDEAGITNINDHTASSFNQALSVSSRCTSRAGLFVSQQNASYGNTSYGVIRVDTLRTSNSGFNYAVFRSNDGADIEFKFRGDADAFADGGWYGGGADYAEYFEWADGNSSSEDRRGYTVVLDGNQIRKATSDDDASVIIGVISGNPSMVGDSDVSQWKHKYQRDNYGTYILDENGDRVLNTDYDEEQEYVSRENRKEWDTVGLMGKLRIRKNQPTGSNWIKMRDVSETIEEWLVR